MWDIVIFKTLPIVHWSPFKLKPEDGFMKAEILFLLINYTRESQPKNLKVRLKFEPQIDCLLSWKQWYSWFEEWSTGGSTMQECNTTAQ